MEGNSINLDELTFHSMKMENPFSSKNGKGLVHYLKDRTEYILEASFVDGKKEGRAILRTSDGQEVGTYFFYRDQECSEQEYMKRREEGKKDLGKASGGIGGSRKSRKNVMELPVVGESTMKKPLHISSWILYSTLAGILVLCILLYYGISYIITGNQLSNGVLSISSCHQFRHIPSWIEMDVQSIVIQDNCCYQSSSVNKVSFSRFINCQSIEIGENALTEVVSMDLRSLKSLKSLSIGDGSLRKLIILSMDDDDSVDIKWKWTARSSAEVTSIPCLVSDLQFDESSGDDPSLDTLDFSHVYNLHTVRFGEQSLPYIKNIHLRSLHHLHVFDISSTALRGVEQLVIDSNSLDSPALTYLELSALTNLQSITIGVHSLTGVKTLKATGLPNLHSFLIREGSLMKAKEYCAILFHSD